MPPKKSENQSRLQFSIKRLKEEKKNLKHRRDHLERELYYTEINTKKMKSEWRKLMLKTKLPWVLQDMEEMWHRFDFLIDLKNDSIDHLLEELEDLEEHTGINFQAHAEAVDRFIRLLLFRLTDLNNWYGKEMLELHKIAMSNNESNTKFQSDHEETLRVILYKMENDMIDNNMLASVQLKIKQDDELYKITELEHLLRGQREKKLETLWSSFKKVLCEYQQKTEDRRRLHLQIKAKDNKISALIYAQLIHTDSLHKMITKLEIDLEERKCILNNTVMKMHEERKLFDVTYSTLQTRLSMDRTNDYNRLIKLTTESNTSMQSLENIMKKGENILLFAAVCRKFETLYEKIDPFQLSEKNISRLSHTFQRKKTNTDDIEPQNLVKQVLQSVSKMGVFWRRIGLVKISQLRMAQYQQELIQENKMLRAMLCQYMASITRRNATPIGLLLNNSMNVISAGDTYRHILHEYWQACGHRPHAPGCGL